MRVGPIRPVSKMRSGAAPRARRAGFGGGTDEELGPHVRVVVEHVVADASEVALEACSLGPL